MAYSTRNFYYLLTGSLKLEVKIFLLSVKRLDFCSGFRGTSNNNNRSHTTSIMVAEDDSSSGVVLPLNKVTTTPADNDDEEGDQGGLLTGKAMAEEEPKGVVAVNIAGMALTMSPIVAAPSSSIEKSALVVAVQPLAITSIQEGGA
jgi:hypothetical protein